MVRIWRSFSFMFIPLVEFDFIKKVANIQALIALGVNAKPSRSTTNDSSITTAGHIALAFIHLFDFATRIHEGIATETFTGVFRSGNGKPTLGAMIGACLRCHRDTVPHPIGEGAGSEWVDEAASVSPSCRCVSGSRAISRVGSRTRAAA